MFAKRLDFALPENGCSISGLSIRSLESVELNDVLLKAWSIVPCASDWGLLIYDDGPVVAGGGAGGFVWFSSSKELKSFLKRLRSLAGDAPPDHPSEQQAIASLNAHLSGVLQISWVGQFEELLSGDTSLNQEVRAWFRTNSGAKIIPGALSAEEGVALSHALQDFGL